MKQFPITAMNLTKTYGTSSTLVEALKPCHFTIQPEEQVAIVGASGSGKSTLLHLLGGLDRPTSGTVFYGKDDIYKRDQDQLAVFRRRTIGFVFQSYNLVPELSAYENIVLPLILDGKKSDSAYIKNIIEWLGLSRRLSHLPGQLSGGQQQRVAIARALANKPSVLFCDEPTGNLDSSTTKEVIKMINALSKELHFTLITVTHDLSIARQYNRILTIEDGMVGGDL